jgi:hypothetical protein
VSKETASLLLDISEWLLLGSGTVLCFGIVGEYAQGDWWKKRIRLWEMLVILGVAFELIGDGGVFLFGKTLQRIEGKEIVSLNALATEAEGHAKTALTDSGTALTKSGQANDKSDAAKDKAGKAVEESNAANNVAGNAKIKADAASAKAAAVDRDLEASEVKRAELEKSIAPREIWLKTYEDGTTNVDDLKALGTIEVHILYVQDAEALRTSADLAFLFRKAGWKATFTPVAVPLRDGITVRAYDPVIPPSLNSSPMSPLILGVMHSTEVCETVAEWLRLNNWSEVSSGNDLTKKIGPNEIVVDVGFKPNPYFAGQQIKNMNNEASRIYLNSHIRSKAPNANPAKRVKTCELQIGSTFSLVGAPCP